MLFFLVQAPLTKYRRDALQKEFLALADGKCGVECVANRCCPFRHVRFESDAGTRLVAPSEELPRDIVSQLLTNVGMDDRLATFVPRAFEGIPRTRLKRYALCRFLLLTT